MRKCNSARLPSRFCFELCHVRPPTPGAASRLSQEYASFSRSIVTWCNSAVNRSFFLCFAASRTRSSPWNTLSRLGVRHVCCSPVFPSVPSLGSADSAPGCPGLFADFFATVEGSDFSCLFFIGFDSSSSRCGPLENSSSGQAGDLPVLVQRAFLHARV